MQDKQDCPQVQKGPLISFILTYYNLPMKMLCECIESILALSLQPSEREIIVVDDGSETSIISQLVKYGNDIIFIRQANQGLSVARNTGIQMAKGEFLQFVDGDDKLINIAYEHCIAIAKTGQAEMVTFDFSKTETEGKPFTALPMQSGTNYMRNNNIRGMACGYLFKRAILGDLRFTKGIYHEDEEFTPLLLIRAEKVCVTNAKAYFYRERPDSIINNRLPRKMIKRITDMKGVISRLNIIADRIPADDKAAIRRRVAQLTMDYLYNIILQTQSRHFLDRKIDELTKEGLFPLPKRNYTAKYTWFRRLSKSTMGLSLLMRIIPIMQKER